MVSRDVGAATHIPRDLECQDEFSGVLRRYLMLPLDGGAAVGQAGRSPPQDSGRAPAGPTINVLVKDHTLLELATILLGAT